MLLVLCLAQFCLAFCTKTHCIQHQNAPYFAPKRSAFSTKTQYIQRQIGQNLVQMAVSLNKNSFHCIHKLPPFVSKPTFTRIDFLRQDERLVDKKSTHNVKFTTKNQTKQLYRKHARAANDSEKLYACYGQRGWLQGMLLSYSIMQTKQYSAFDKRFSTCREWMEQPPSGCLLKHNHVLPQTNRAKFQVLSCLHPTISYMSRGFIWVLEYKENRLLSICRNIKGQDDFFI